MTRQQERDLIIQGFRELEGREPNRPEAQLVHGVAELETQVGRGWEAGNGAGSFNCGALTAGSQWHGDKFMHRDSRPNADGTNTWYETYFRSYPTLAAGLKDVVNFCYCRNTVWGRCSELVLPKATAGDLQGFSTGLYVTKYYLGFGATPEQRIAGHVAKLTAACIRIARELHEPMPDGSEPPAPPPATVKLGSHGDVVVTVQMIVGAAPDSFCGPKTVQKIVAWQAARHLKQDGIFGPACWAEAKQEGLVH